MRARSLIACLAAALTAATAAAAEKKPVLVAFSFALDEKRLDVGVDNLVRESATANVIVKVTPRDVEDHGRAVVRVDARGNVRLRSGEKGKWRRVATLDSDDQLIFPNGERIWFDVATATVRSSSTGRKLLPLAWTGVTAQTRRSAMLLWVFFDDGVAATVAKLSAALR